MITRQRPKRSFGRWLIGGLAGLAGILGIGGCGGGIVIPNRATFRDVDILQRMRLFDPEGNCANSELIGQLDVNATGVRSYPNPNALEFQLRNWDLDGQVDFVVSYNHDVITTTKNEKGVSSSTTHNRTDFYTIREIDGKLWLFPLDLKSKDPVEDKTVYLGHVNREEQITAEVEKRQEASRVQLEEQLRAQIKTELEGKFVLLPKDQLFNGNSIEEGYLDPSRIRPVPVDRDGNGKQEVYWGYDTDGDGNLDEFYDIRPQSVTEGDRTVNRGVWKVENVAGPMKDRLAGLVYERGAIRGKPTVAQPLTQEQLTMELNADVAARLKDAAARYQEFLSKGVLDPVTGLYGGLDSRYLLYVRGEERNMTEFLGTVAQAVLGQSLDAGQNMRFRFQVSRGGLDRAYTVGCNEDDGRIYIIPEGTEDNEESRTYITSPRSRK